MFDRFRIWLKDKLSGRPTTAHFQDREIPRSDKWPTVRKHHLQEEDSCQWCGGKVKLEVHHMMPFHLDPAKELNDANLITLCESGGNDNCHFIHGHLGDWKKFNPDVRVQCDAHKAPFPPSGSTSPKPS